MATPKLVHIVARPYDAELMRRALAEAGYSTGLTDWGSNGCQQVERERPDAVVLSTRRAEEECALFLRGLRAGDHGQDVPVVVVAEPGSRLATTQLGADRLLLRPLDVAALVAAVRALVGSPDPAAAKLAPPGTISPAAPEESPRRTTGPMWPAVAEEPPRRATGPMWPAVAEEPQRRATGPMPSAAPPRKGTGPIPPAIPDAPRKATGPMPPAVPDAPRKATGPMLPAVVDPGMKILRAGSLREIDPARVIAEAHLAGVTGRLRLRRGEAEKTIVFERGQPIFAGSNLTHDRLGDLLFREGKITREQYRLCEEGVAASGRRLGGVLVDRGLIKPRELLPLIRRQVAEIIYSVFAWTDGSYELTGGEPSSEETVRLDVSAVVLLLEGVRRKYGPDRLQELVGPPETCLQALPAASSLLGGDAPLVPGERSSLELLDGRTSLREVAARTSTDELALYQLAHVAMVLGALTRRGAGEVRVLDGAESVPAARQREQLIDRNRVEAKYAQVLEADYFTLLGVTPEASAHEVLRAYQRVREEFRLETFGAELREEYAEQLAAIAEVVEEAFEVIGDRELKRSYLEGMG